ncbi:helix-turn-helix transcriptional regulator, partial [Burkholderia sp. 4M9327F10]|uniref:helix-turn-helix domain-containing protein n=1 Tax=Burkholderia sp. 4M9327F10 TaxID=2502223 RepID=UPI00201758DC
MDFLFLGGFFIFLRNLPLGSRAQYAGRDIFHPQTVVDIKVTALGNFVRNRRRGLRLTQVALALRMGVDDAYVSAVETGRRVPDGSSFLEALGRALELDEDGLRQLVDASRRSQRYLRLPEELSERKQELISALVEDVRLPAISPSVFRPRYMFVESTDLGRP